MRAADPDLPEIRWDARLLAGDNSGACAIAACLAALERRDVDALAWPRTLPQAEELAAALRERGFVLSAVGDHVLAVRPPHAAVRAAVAATPDAPGNDR